ncbi:lamin tail domain-containing protein [Haloplanus natans]|uniref:lamin tail domain-containing protein n=1 Tax=Haloplanus natans TaxID=376171 RepID=UPI000677C798|nr:lamin tail domain-containing protein [Haloplanus natans]
MFTLAAAALGLALVFGAGAYAVTRLDALDHRAVLVVVAVGLAVGGVAAQAAPVTPATTTGTDRVPDAGAADGRAALEATDSVAATNDSTAVTTATVVGVLAPDRLTYRTAAGERRTVRLAGVAAPGVDGGNPERFDGVVTGQRGRTCLAEQGRRALVDARTSLVGESVTVASVDAGGAVLVADGRSINRRAVERGYARATDDRYADAERAARSAGRGVWSCATVEATPPIRESEEPGMYVAAVHPNPPGDDATALAEEYLVLKNAGDRTVDLSNWYLVDGDGKMYFFFDGRTLRPGEELVVHVGGGRNTDRHVYWGSSSPILDNDHETLKLVDGDTERTVRLSY